MNVSGAQLGALVAYQGSSRVSKGGRACICIPNRAAEGQQVVYACFLNSLRQGLSWQGLVVCCAVVCCAVLCCAGGVAPPHGLNRQLRRPVDPAILGSLLLGPCRSPVALLLVVSSSGDGPAWAPALDHVSWGARASP
jgi:hypothetical protein